MAVAHRASIAASSVNPTTTFAATIPASVVANDVLFVAVTSRDHLVGTALPTCVDTDSGGNTWTRIGGSTDRKAHIFWKRATSATASKVITVAGCVGSCSGGVSCYSGAILTGDPFTDFLTETNASGDESNATFTPTNANSFVCLTVHNYANDNAITAVTCTDPGALATRFEKLSTGGSDCACIFASGGPQAGGPTATGAISWTQATNGVSYSIRFAIKPQVGTAYTLTADSASFVITGNAAAVRAAKKLAGASTSFAITPTSPVLRKANKVLAAAASFLLSANLVGLAVDRDLVSSPATFTHTPNVVGLRVDRILAAEPPLGIPTLTVEGVSDTELLLSWGDVVTGLVVEGVSDTELLLTWDVTPNLADYNFEPNDVILAKGYTFSLVETTFSFDGNNARLARTPAALIAEYALTTPVNFTATNNATELVAFIDLAWQPGPAIQFTPNDAALTATHQLVAEPTVFTFTPADVTFPSGLGMVAQPASFTWTPNTVGLIAHKILGVASGSFAITPNAAILRTSGNLIAETFAAVITGNNVTLTYTPQSSFSLQLDPAKFLFTGNPAVFPYTYVLNAAPRAYTITGNSVTFTVGTGQVLNEPFFINLSTGQTFINVTTKQTFIDIE